MKKEKTFNLKEHINKHTNLYALLIFILIVLSGIFGHTFEVNDELWNFSNVYKMSNGYTIYNDLNVIITPLFFYIGMILFKIIGANYFAFRIYNFFIVLFLLWMVYKTLMLLKIDNIASIVCSIILVGTSSFIFPGANYNLLALGFYILGMYLYLRIQNNDNNKDNKNDKFVRFLVKYNPYLQGLIAGIIFLIKQNTGVYYLIACVILHIVLAIKNKSYKQEIIKCVKLGLIFTIIIVLFALCMYINGNLNSFINFCFLGISEFSIGNISFSWIIIDYIILVLSSIIYSCVILFNKKISFKNTSEMRMNNLIILPFMIMILLTSYPIFNTYHIMVASVISSILVIYNIKETLIIKFFDKEHLNKLEKAFKTILIFMIILSFGKLIAHTYMFNKSLEVLDDYNNPYFGSNIDKDDLEHMNRVIDYIKSNDDLGIRTIIVSPSSNGYMNLLNKNNGKFDLPIKGNLGKDGVIGLIEDIKKLDNVKILIIDSEYSYQEDDRIYEYIKNNLTYEGKIEDFHIYSL